jgi:hypothetical protein
MSSSTVAQQQKVSCIGFIKLPTDVNLAKDHTNLIVLHIAR